MEQDPLKQSVGLWHSVGVALALAAGVAAPTLDAAGGERTRRGDERARRGGTPQSFEAVDHRGPPRGVVPGGWLPEDTSRRRPLQVGAPPAIRIGESQPERRGAKNPTSAPWWRGFWGESQEGSRPALSHQHAETVWQRFLYLFEGSLQAAQCSVASARWSLSPTLETHDQESARLRASRMMQNLLVTQLVAALEAVFKDEEKVENDAGFQNLLSDFTRRYSGFLNFDQAHLERMRSGTERERRALRNLEIRHLWGSHLQRDPAASVEVLMRGQQAAYREIVEHKLGAILPFWTSLSAEEQMQICAALHALLVVAPLPHAVKVLNTSGKGLDLGFRALSGRGTAVEVEMISAPVLRVIRALDHLAGSTAVVFHQIFEATHLRSYADPSQNIASQPSTAQMQKTYLKNAALNVVNHLLSPRMPGSWYAYVQALGAYYRPTPSSMTVDEVAGCVTWTKQVRLDHAQDYADLPLFLRCREIMLELEMSRSRAPEVERLAQITAARVTADVLARERQQQQEQMRQPLRPVETLSWPEQIFARARQDQRIGELHPAAARWVDLGDGHILWWAQSEESFRSGAPFDVMAWYRVEPGVGPVSVWAQNFSQDIRLRQRGDPGLIDWMATQTDLRMRAASVTGPGQKEPALLFANDTVVAAVGPTFPEPLFWFYQRGPDGDAPRAPKLSLSERIRDQWALADSEQRERAALLAPGAVWSDLEVLENLKGWRVGLLVPLNSQQRNANESCAQPVALLAVKSTQIRLLGGWAHQHDSGPRALRQSKWVFEAASEVVAEVSLVTPPQTSGAAALGLQVRDRTGQPVGVTLTDGTHGDHQFMWQAFVGSRVRTEDLLDLSLDGDDALRCQAAARRFFAGEVFGEPNLGTSADGLDPEPGGDAVTPGQQDEGSSSGREVASNRMLHDTP